MLGINLWPIPSEARSKTAPVHNASQDKLGQYRTTLRLAGKEIERRNRVIRALTTFGHQASRVSDPTALMRLALEQVIHVTAAQVGAIILIDRNSNKLSLGTHVGLSPYLIRVLTGRQIDANAALFMPHVANGRGVLLEIDDSTSEVERALLYKSQVGSLTSLPLTAGDHLLGALVVGIKEAIKFPPADIHFLMAIAQGTAVALEQLHLREKIWHMAEAMLSQESFTNHQAQQLHPNEHRSLLPPVQEKLAEIIIELGGNIGAVFTLDKLSVNTPISLIVNYGLSPLWVTDYTQFLLSDNVFPFEQLRHHALIVKNILEVNKNHTIPLCQRFQEEGVRSLIAAQIEDSSESSSFIFIATNKSHAFDNSHVERLIELGEQLTPILSYPLAVPTLPNQNIHIPSLERQATDDDLESLLEAMMRAEEEVERHNIDLVSLNTISDLLNRALQQNTIWNKILQEILALLQAEAIWLYFLQKELNVLELKFHEGLPDAYLHEKKRVYIGDDCIEGQVVSTQEAQFVYDLTLDPRYNYIFSLWEDIRSIAVIPLISQIEESSIPVGILVLSHTTKANDWDPRQKRLLQTITNQLALAINNIQLYEQVKASVTVLSSSNAVLKQVNDHLMEAYNTRPLQMLEGDDTLPDESI